MLFLVLPFLAAVMYPLGSLLLKRSAVEGAGPWRATFVCNILLALFASVYFFSGAEISEEARWYQPATVAALFFTGQILTFAAIHAGDVSVATPMMGAKVLLVVVFASFLTQEPVPTAWWWSAGVSAVGVALLGLTPGSGHRRVLATVMFALLSSAAFALSDVLCQRWGPAWGGTPLVARAFALAGGLSFVLLLFAKGPVSTIPRGAWRWLLPGAALIALQSILIVTTLATFGAAPAVNIVFGTRGLWSIALVVCLAKWAKLPEQHAPRSTFILRAIGALLLTVSVAILLAKPPA
jgi:drug/metabolite transporter (DMT)-like permease